MESRSKIEKSDMKAGLSRGFDLLRQQAQDQGKGKMKQIGEESFTKKPQDEELTKKYQDAKTNAQEALKKYQTGNLSREEYLVVDKNAIEAFDAWIGRKPSS